MDLKFSDVKVTKSNHFFIKMGTKRKKFSGCGLGTSTWEDKLMTYSFSRIDKARKRYSSISSLSVDGGQNRPIFKKSAAVNCTEVPG